MARLPIPRFMPRLRPLLDFLQSESAGGAMLMLAAVVALIWANSPLAAEYEALWHWTPPVSPRLELHVWVNDALMAVFFLLVGLELRREMTRGALASADRLAAPGLAALGGMVVPALIFTAFNYHDAEAMRGWAVPVATDIAFALAVLSMLGSRVPIALKVFLTALAIMDDLGAIVIIALFYTAGLDFGALGFAALAWLVLFALGRAGMRQVWPYLVGGVFLWALVFKSGVHATLAGVALAFVVPMGDKPGEAAAPAERLEHGLGRWVAFLVLPVFGLANAGLGFGHLPADTLSDPLTIGIGLGLIVGKQVGVFGALMAAIKAGVARMPSGVNAGQIYGASILCGIGFTMSLFIGDIAFRGTPRGEEIKLAVFGASLISAMLGLVVLVVARERTDA